MNAIQYLAPFLAAFVTALLAMPLCKRGCLRLGLVDDPGNRKIHEHPVALAGGITILTALVVPAVIGFLMLHFAGSGDGPGAAGGSPGHGVAAGWIPLFNPAAIHLLLHGLARRASELGVVLVGAGGMFALGLLDDRRELSPPAKFTGQLLIAFFVASAGIRITLFVPSALFSYAITILWILTVVNAFNFVDNMNGLCAGLGILAAAGFFAFSALAGQYLVALLAALMCGALLGFLPYNFPRARAFLGDSGSHLAGYLLAVLAILPHFYTKKHPIIPAVLTPLLVLGVPLADLAWVVCLRWRKRRPIYIGDTNHLSHCLVRLGLSEVQAVLLLWSAGAALDLAALALSRQV